MCKSMISIDYGYVYDCDFNQMLNIPLSNKKIHISQIDKNYLNQKRLLLQITVLDALLEQVVVVEGLYLEMKFSIVIPTLNEESTLISNLKFFRALKKKLDAEIIIVDGQSCDKTKEIAKSLTDKLYDVNPSRSSAAQ